MVKVSPCIPCLCPKTTYICDQKEYLSFSPSHLTSDRVLGTALTNNWTGALEHFAKLPTLSAEQVTKENCTRDHIHI